MGSDGSPAQAALLDGSAARMFSPSIEEPGAGAAIVVFGMLSIDERALVMTIRTHLAGIPALRAA